MGRYGCAEISLDGGPRQVGFHADFGYYDLANDCQFVFRLARISDRSTLPIVTNSCTDWCEFGIVNEAVRNPYRAQSVPDPWYILLEYYAVQPPQGRGRGLWRGPL